MDLDNPSAMVLAQRIRNRIIEYLETASSYEDQLEYERRVPIADVPTEMIEMWEDSVKEEALDWYIEPVFSPEEQQAIRDFQATWQSVIDDTPQFLPPLADLIGTEPWERLRKGAESALAVFSVRGKFDEEREMFASG